VTFEEKKHSYGSYFEPEAYLKFYFCQPGDQKEQFRSWAVPERQLTELERAIRFKIRSMRLCIESALESKEGPARVLDLSTGPFCGNMMFASGFDQVSEVVCSDFLEANRDYINRVVSDSTSCNFNWSGFCKWAYGNEQLVQSFQRKCRNMAFVDMSSEQDGFEQIEQLSPPSGALFDVITSEWAFCEGARDLDNYEAVIARCHKLLNKGGSLILLDLLEQTFWVPDGTKPDRRVPTVKVSQGWLCDCLKRNGFAIEQLMLQFYENTDCPYFDAKGNVLVWATKL